MKTLYKVYFCYHHEQARSPNQYKEFVCITTADRVAKISEHYSELWGLIMDPCHVTAKGDYIPAEELTESKILQEWEGLDFYALLEDIETGEKFWYVAKQDGYELDEAI